MKAWARRAGLLAAAFLLAAPLACRSSDQPPEDPAAAAARSLFERTRDGTSGAAAMAGLVRQDLLDLHGPALAEILPGLRGWTDLRVLASSRRADGTTDVDLEATFASGARSSFSVAVSRDGRIEWILTPGAEWPPPRPSRGGGLASSPPG